MKQITTLDSTANQSIYFVTEDRELLHFTFLFSPRQQAWFLNLESDKLNLYGIQLCCHPNILDKYHNLINYGISIITNDGLDPWRVTDFGDGYCMFCILNSEELKQVTERLDGEQV